MARCLFIESLSHAELVEIVCEQVHSDWRLSARLDTRLASSTDSAVDVGFWRSRLISAFAPYDDFVGYAEAAGWAAEVRETLDALDDLITAGHAVAVVDLVEFAHRQLMEARHYVDDSSGELSDIASQIGEIHFRACDESDPDPVQAARRLLQLELRSEFDCFHHAANTYRDILGPEGLLEFRSIVEPLWTALSARSAADEYIDDESSDGDDDEYGEDGVTIASEERVTPVFAPYAIREAMIGVVLAGEDVDDLVRVYSSRLVSPSDYQRIAVVLRGANRVDEAIDWARRGLAAFAGPTGHAGPVRETLAEMFRDRGEMAKAAALFWDAFESAPSVQSYERMLVESALVGNPDDDRSRALTLLRSRVAPAAEPAAERGTPRRLPLFEIETAASTLIRVLLLESDAESAWRAADEYGCSERLRLEIALARESEHPADSIVVYRAEIERRIAVKNNDAYAAAVDLLDRIRRLGAASGDDDQFRRLVVDIRVRHKPKRNLMAMLARRGW